MSPIVQNVKVKAFSHLTDKRTRSSSVLPCCCKHLKNMYMCAGSTAQVVLKENPAADKRFLTILYSLNVLNSAAATKPLFAWIFFLPSNRFSSLHANSLSVG